MRGQILGVDTRAGEGQIAGEDGRRYAFRPEDWAHRGEPAIGLQVDFEPENSRALSIFPVPGAQPVATQMYPAAPREPTTSKNKIVAALLAFFLGVLGVHRFYLGRTGSGIVMLVLTVTVIGTLITVPWSWVDTIRYLVMSDRDFARRFGND
ncbi:TM2 domain-containing protein [Sphingomonas aerophila]|jgi:TM2 domain-containing membrane protein YozV|uniref:TM2 domain-containing membrane protein YozV n=1 Tax=Sphingomonas aerophila TaxID=1344948 RepID=A0A7W9BAE7_9SPHN|nr:TM2 domain-containing protein [Sphingomonas aerophila]MBB5713553.1 TM2 domain-containing membrane protein YozV [Sphingomonas aerophila]